MRRRWLVRLLCLLLVVMPVSLLAPPGPLPTARAATFVNYSDISIPSPGQLSGPAEPYPSPIFVSGITGSVSKVTVTLFGINHTDSDDLDILLVGPGGQSVILMSDVARNEQARDVTLTFDDAAGAPPPTTMPLASGIFRPIDHDPTGVIVDQYFPPAPSGPSGATLSVFNGTDPNGTWSLYVVDDSVFSLGLVGGWEISINNSPPIAGLPGPNPTYIENGLPVVLFPGAVITDPDSANFRNGGLFVGVATGAHPADRLRIRNQGTAPGQIGVVGNSVSFDGLPIGTFTGGDGSTPLIVKLDTFDATAPAAQAALRNVTFQNDSDQPAPTTRFLQVGVGDGDGGISAPATKVITVVLVNDPPTISDIPDQFSFEGGGFGPLPFTVGDPETPPGSLTVTASSSNPTVAPDGGITLGGAGASRTITVQTTGRAGVTVITVTVSDGQLTASDVFAVRVGEEMLIDHPVQRTIGPGASHERTLPLISGQRVRFSLTGAAERIILFNAAGEIVGRVPAASAAGQVQRRPAASAALQFIYTAAATGVYRVVVGDTDGQGGAYELLVQMLPTSGAAELVWYFAEGYTGPGFDQYFTILNPNGQDANVRITYYLGGGQAPVVKTLVAPANARTTVAVHDVALGVGRNQEVAAKVESTNDVGLVVERPIYFRYGALPGGHNVMGATAPRLDWYFAEGYTGPGFDEYLTILNPSATDATLRITYFLGGGRAPVVKTLTAPANARTTVTVHDAALGVGRNQEVAARVESVNGVVVVVERPMYFTYGGGITGGHNVLGANAPSPAWSFAEGFTGAGFDQYFTILNPGNADASVRITYFLGGGQAPVVKTLTAPANARTTVVVHDATLGVGRNQEVSALVETTNGVGIVVERPMYFRYGSIPDGHNVMGARGPATIWRLAEGYTGPGFDEYLTILNPNPTPAEIRVTYYLGGGRAPVVKTLTAAANARTTIAVHDAAQGVGRNQEVAAKVESTNGVGVVVERPMYFTYGAGVTGGHNVMGYTP